MPAIQIVTLFRMFNFLVNRKWLKNIFLKLSPSSPVSNSQ